MPKLFIFSYCDLLAFTEWVADNMAKNTNGTLYSITDIDIAFE